MRFCSACGAALSSTPPVTCAACGRRHYRNAKPCAGALAVHDGRLLLVQRADQPWQGRWDIPGGFCEADEHPEDAAIRELREETGLDGRVTGILGMWLDHYPDPGDSAGATTLNIYFHVEISGGEERPQPGEVERLGWFAADALPAPDETAFPHHALDVLEAWKAQVSRS